MGKINIPQADLDDVINETGMGMVSTDSREFSEREFMDIDDSAGSETFVTGHGDLSVTNNPIIVSVVGIDEAIRELGMTNMAINRVIMVTVPKVADWLRDEIKSVFGDPSKLAPLSELTKWRHRNQGGSASMALRSDGDTPLVFSGDLRDSIKTDRDEDSVNANGRNIDVSVSIGSDDPHLKDQMYGYSYQSKHGLISVPPRDPVTPTVENNIDKIERAIVNAVYKAIDKASAIVTRNALRGRIRTRSGD